MLKEDVPQNSRVQSGRFVLAIKSTEDVKVISDIVHSTSSTTGISE